MHRLILALLLLGAAPASAADLALKRVMLSSAGVGYFEYDTEVDGPATLGLDVPLDQVDDVLTSLVVFDSTGAVGTVELPGRDSTRANFGNVPFGPEALRSAVDYLNSLQGVDISVQGPRPMTGRIMHAERVAETLPAADGQPKPTVQRTRVTILSPEGLRQFVLEEVDSIQVADPDLRARIGQALDSLRREANQSVRHLTLHSTGDGHRTVRVGYVAAAPLWKASYRLVLPAKDGDPARLQGWAVLENQSGADWNDVALTLQYRQSRHVPPGNLPELLCAAAGSAGGDPGPHPAERRYTGATRFTGDAEGHSRSTGRPISRRHGRADADGAREAEPWPRRQNRRRLPKPRSRQSSSSQHRSRLPPAIPRACRSSMAPFPPRGWIWPQAMIRIHCRRSASPTTPARRSLPAC